MPGIRFRSRPYERRERALRPLEVAVLEVLHDPAVIEISEQRMQSRIKELVAKGSIRGDVLVTEANDEARPMVCTRIAEIIGAG